MLESSLGKELSSVLNQWQKAVRYFDDGRIDSNKNCCERAVRPFVTGRKAWIIYKPLNGANISAIFYSIVQTTLANGLVPYDYLMHVMEIIMQGNVEPEQLLYWNVE